MKNFCVSILATCIALAAAGAVAKDWDFENAEPGKLPEKWSTAKTGKGSGSVWEISTDKSAPKGDNVLTQTSSEGPRRLYNLCVAEGTSYTDVDLSVAMKPLSGRIDQGGGPVWRYQDHDNYYIARMNPLELNYRVYKVVGGKRKQLASADVEVDADDAVKALRGKWHTIRIVHRGEKIQCYLNGHLDLEVTDNAITKPGKIGLWTKADAVTAFDALSIVETEEDPQ